MSTETNSANQKTVGKHKAGIIPRKQNSFLNNKKTTNKRTQGNAKHFCLAPPHFRIRAKIRYIFLYGDSTQNEFRLLLNLKNPEKKQNRVALNSRKLLLRTKPQKYSQKLNTSQGSLKLVHAKSKSDIIHEIIANQRTF